MSCKDVDKKVLINEKYVKKNSNEPGADGDDKNNQTTL